MSATVDIIVLGAKGRMGQMVLQACANRIKGGAPLRVIGAIEPAGSPNLGQRTGVDGIDAVITSDIEALLGPGAVVIDFTSPQASLATLAAIRRKGGAHVLCTTGLGEAEKETVREAARSVPVVMSPNMSMGVTLMFRVAENSYDSFVYLMQAMEQQQAAQAQQPAQQRR